MDKQLSPREQAIVDEAQAKVRAAVESTRITVQQKIEADLDRIEKMLDGHEHQTIVCNTLEIHLTMHLLAFQMSLQAMMSAKRDASMDVADKAFTKFAELHELTIAGMLGGYINDDDLCQEIFAVFATLLKFQVGGMAAMAANGMELVDEARTKMHGNG